MEQSHGEARLRRRIGIESIEVVTFPAAVATGRIEWHFAGAGRRRGGEHIGAAASRAWAGNKLGVAVAHDADLPVFM